MYFCVMIRCLNPRTITNPKLPQEVCRLRSIYLNGLVIDVPNSQLGNYFFDFPWSSFSITKFDIPKFNADDNLLSNYFVFSKLSGECVPIFIQVPCNHCDLCNDSKVMSFSNRVNLEMQCYKQVTWFVTLTYNDAYKPQQGVDKRHVQLFLKRLRINLNRSGYLQNWRYVK